MFVIRIDFNIQFWLKVIQLSNFNIVILSVAHIALLKTLGSNPDYIPSSMFRSLQVIYLQLYFYHVKCHEPHNLNMTMASNSYLYRYFCKNVFIFSCCLWPFWLWLFWLCYTESWKRGLCICNRQADTTGGLDCTIQGRQMPNTRWKAKIILHTGMGIWS